MKGWATLLPVRRVTLVQIAFSLSKRSRYASEGFQSSGFRATHWQTESDPELPEKSDYGNFCLIRLATR
jgi:hypothetical protein